MFASTDISLISLIENKQVIYAVVDYMDNHATELVNEAVYIQAVRKLIQTKTRKTEQQRLAKTFDLENLISAGLVIEVDKATRNILFHSAVIEIFRLFDSKRLRELTNADLEDLSARLDNAREGLLKHISGDTEDLDEQIEVVFLLLSEISSRLQTNTRSLQSKAQNLAETIDVGGDLTLLEDVAQKHRTLAEIHKIYHRNILPMLEFLNEYEQIKGLSPLKKITAIHNILEDFSYTDEAYRVQQYKISITTHYKTIESISQLLERYSRQEKRYRQQYNCIESAYQLLMDSAEQLSDGKLNTQYFNEDDPCFNHADALYGLKHYRAAQKSLINWADINHRAYLDEYLLNAEQRKLDENSVAQVQSLLHKEKQLEKWQGQQHKNELEKFIDQIIITAPVDDIYSEIFSLLQESIEQADLSDVLFIAKQLQINKQWNLKVHFEQEQSILVHTKTSQKLSYWRRELQA
ncbi:MAG: hypothetical protein KZQ83_07755 [gamma proteobacterium symbiont of Taylorina sp.]|nr:hypothetical protein [gamma proteobacterium symbiont of Taylorina sp.]